MLGLDILKKYDQKLKSFVNSKVIPPISNPLKLLIGAF